MGDDSERRIILKLKTMGFETEKEVEEFLYRRVYEPNEEELFFCPTEEDVYGDGDVGDDPRIEVDTPNKKEHEKEI